MTRRTFIVVVVASMLVACGDDAQHGRDAGGPSRDGGTVADAERADAGDDPATDAGGAEDAATDAGPADAGFDSAVACGDGVVGSDESCDLAIAATEPGACPATCDDGESCTVDELVGSDCDVACMFTAITENADGDGCCLAGATIAVDDDCPMRCGDGVVSSPETCDTAIPTGDLGACPATCTDADACTIDAIAGEACEAVCEHRAITAHVPDGCCPAGASIATDSDCPIRCGDGVVSAGETCDSGIPAGSPGECIYRLVLSLFPTSAPCMDDWLAEAFPESGCSGLSVRVPFASVTCTLRNTGTGAIVATRTGVACGATPAEDPSLGFESGRNSNDWSALITVAGEYSVTYEVRSAGGRVRMASRTFVVGPPLCSPVGPV